MAALPVQTAGPLSETGANILGKGRKRLLKQRESGDLACSAGGLVRGGWSDVQPVAGGLARELYGGRAMGAGGGEGKSWLRSGPRSDLAAGRSRPGAADRQGDQPQPGEGGRYGGEADRCPGGAAAATAQYYFKKLCTLRTISRPDCSGGRGSSWPRLTFSRLASIVSIAVSRCSSACRP